MNGMRKKGSAVGSLRGFFLRGCVIVVLAVLLAAPAMGAEGELDVSGLDELEQAAGEYGVEEGATLEEALPLVLEQGMDSLEEVLRSGVAVGCRLLGVAALCALARSMVGNGLGGTVRAVEMAGALAVTALAAGDMGAMIGLGRETVAAMDQFSKLLLPVMAVLTAATGSVTAAAARQGATMLFSSVLIQLIDKLLIPLVYVYVALCCAQAAADNQGLKKLAGLVKGVVSGTVTALLLAFVAYLTASSSVAGSADAAAVKAAKLAISRAVPVVGGILSDAAESVLVGAGVLRGSVGVMGMLVVLAICVGPFLHLGTHYLTYKLAAALAGTVAPGELAGLIDSLGGAFGLVLGMTGACAVLMLVSVVAGVSAVVPG